jgi:hypothetical protein
MADWPDAIELKQVLDVSSEDFDETLYRVMAAGIAKVKADRGGWDDAVDVPDDNMAQAALRMAELLALRPEAAADTIKDPTYNRLMTGRRRVFGVG